MIQTTDIPASPVGMVITSEATDKERPVNIIFVEPFFPQNQRRFVAALAGVGANVIGVGEYAEDDLGDELRGQLGAYYRVSNVTDEGQLNAAVNGRRAWCGSTGSSPRSSPTRWRPRRSGRPAASPAPRCGPRGCAGTSRR